MNSNERILRLVRDEIDRSGSVGTNVSRIAAALRQQGVDPITARMRASSSSRKARRNTRRMVAG